MRNIKWFYHRLKAMSAGEIVHRINEKKKKATFKLKYKENVSILELNYINFNNVGKLNKVLEQLWNFKSIEELNSSYEIMVFDRKLDLRERFSWHGLSEEKWPNNTFSGEIDFKNKEDLGEIRQTWELNRHIFMPYLVLKSEVENDAEDYIKLKELFYSWVEENPFLKGVNWSSPMEIAIRAYQWLLCYAIIKENEDKSFQEDLLRAAVNSIEYVTKNFSRFSSANNHLILEASICSMVGYAVKDIYKQQWFMLGYDILKDQFKKQFYKDGVNKEQSTHYHGFVVDIWLQYNCFLRSIGKNTLQEDLLFKSVEFLGYLKVNKEFVEFGDSDDAKIINVTGESYNYYEYILQFASKYFKTNFTESNHLKEYLIWKAVSNNKVNMNHTYIHSKLYPDGGYYIFQDSNKFLLFDIGNLGFGKLAAHGHADCLSIIYYKYGKPIFIDPGTYIYNIKKDYRDYFRSTEAHNTLTYKDRSQSKMEGPFLWSNKANIISKEYYEDDNVIGIKAIHNGYKPYTHSRSIVIHKKYDLIMIKDLFDGDEAKIHFTLHKDVKLTQDTGNSCKLNNNIFVTMTNAFKFVDKKMSSAFLSLDNTCGIVSEKSYGTDFITVISENPVTVKGNTIIYEDRLIEFTDFNNVKEKNYENC